MKNYGPKFSFETRFGPLGQYHLDLVSQYYPAADIISVIGHDMAKYKYCPKKIENYNWEDTSDIESVRLALNILPAAERALFILGETYFTKDDLNFKYGQSACVSYYDEYDEDVGFNIQDDLVVTTAFEFKNKFGGMLYLDGHEFRVMKNFASNRNSRCDLYEYFSQIERHRIKIKVNKCSPDFVKVTELDELERLL